MSGDRILEKIFILALVGVRRKRGLWRNKWLMLPGLPRLLFGYALCRFGAGVKMSRREKNNVQWNGSSQ